MSVPERDRTDAEWDELNELEIQTAPGNRSSGQPTFAYSGKPAGTGGSQPGKSRFKGKPRNNKPGGGQGNPGGPRPPQAGQKPHKPRPA